MRFIQMALIIPFLMATAASAQTQIDIAGFKLGEDAQRYVVASHKSQAANEAVTERMTAVGGLSGPYTFNMGGMFMDTLYGTRVAHVPTEGGKVDIAFFCPEEGNQSYSISQHRDFRGAQQDDVIEVLIKKYGRPTSKFSASLNRAGTVFDKYLFWANDGIPISREDMQAIGKKEGFSFKGGGLLVKVKPATAVVAVWLQLLTRGWEARSNNCRAKASSRARETAKSAIRF